MLNKVHAHRRSEKREHYDIFSHAVLRGIEVFAADSRNDFMQDGSPEKHFTSCSTKFRLKNIDK